MSLNSRVIFTIQGAGLQEGSSFTVEVFQNDMPITASNFLDLCANHFYERQHIHRTIPDYLIQFGCKFSKEPGDARIGTGFAKENSEFKHVLTGEKLKRNARGCVEDEFKNPLCPKITNDEGTLAVANAGTPDSFGSQVIINLADNNFLDWWDDEVPSQCPVFGKICEGLDVVRKIGAVLARDDVPVHPVMIDRVEIVDAV
jgi:cyclophilin family peptidyl-prolyl cis-trans isomerase